MFPFIYRCDMYDRRILKAGRWRWCATASNYDRVKMVLLCWGTLVAMVTMSIFKFDILHNLNSMYYGYAPNLKDLIYSLSSLLLNHNVNCTLRIISKIQVASRDAHWMIRIKICFGFAATNLCLQTSLVARIWRKNQLDINDKAIGFYNETYLCSTCTMSYISHYSISTLRGIGFTRCILVV